MAVPADIPFRIRSMTEGDIETVVSAEGGSSWLSDRSYWTDCLQEQAKGARQVVLAWLDEDVAGYGSLIWESEYPPFKEENTPEINNLRVAEQFRGQGIATEMVAHFQEVAVAANCTAIGVGVGLYADYGSAQRLYVRLGFVPDGRGVTNGNQFAEPGARVRLDDDLLLWLVKKLRPASRNRTRN